MLLSEKIVMIAAGILALPLFIIVHNVLNNCCVQHAWKYCRKKNYKVQKWKCDPEFDASGKTEFSVVALDCLDGQGQRRLVKLLVWVFGVRKLLSDEKWPESQDEKASPSLHEPMTE